MEEYFQFSADFQPVLPVNFGVGGAITGALQNGLPIYRIYNGYNKQRALKKYGRAKMSAGKHAALHAALNTNLIPGSALAGTALHAHTSHKFEDLRDDLAEKYLRKHPNATKSDVKKAIKDALYYNTDSKFIKKSEADKGVRAQEAARAAKQKARAKADAEWLKGYEKQKKLAEKKRQKAEKQAHDDWKYYVKHTGSRPVTNISLNNSNSN